MKRMKMILTLVVLCALSSPVMAGSMAVNFPGELSISGSVGASGYAQVNWLNTVGTPWPDSWGTQYMLQDESGTTTGAKLEWWASGFGAQQTYVTTDFPMESRMLETTLGAATVDDPVRVHVVDVPYAQYDVVVYFGARQPFATVQKVIVNDQFLFGQVGYYKGYTEIGYAQIPGTSTSDLAANTPIGNYMVFKGLSSSTLDIMALPGWYSGVDPRAFISGFQIVEVPEPATMVLLGAGALCSVIRKRSR